MSSNYETDNNELGRGKRKKMKNQFLCDESFSTKKKKLKNTSSSDYSDVDENDVIQEVKSKKSAPSPPLISFSSQNNKKKKNTKGSKTKETEILKKNNLEKNNEMLTSRESNKSRKDIILTKICQARKVISSLDKINKKL